MQIIEVLLPAIAFILGSVPCGLILTRIFASVDIRQKGSGNIGATNVRRIAGSKLGALTLIGDMSKGAIPVYFALSMTDFHEPSGACYISLVILSAFLGHLYPIFMKFKDGGKGVATAAGAFFVISPTAFAVVLSVFIIVVRYYRQASIGSLAAAAVLPITIWITTGSGVLTGCAGVITLFIYFRHKDNIRRLLSGTEPEIRL